METAASTLTGTAHIADVLNHLALPFFVLTVSYLAEYSLIMRSSLMEVLGDDFILVARAKGVRERNVRRRHAVPNALLPVMTVTILSLGYVLGGAIVIETIFSWPGLGRLTYTAIGNQDYALLEGLFLVFSAAVIVVEPGGRPPLFVPRPTRESGLIWRRRRRTFLRARSPRRRSTRRRSPANGGKTRSGVSGSNTGKASWGWQVLASCCSSSSIAIFAPVLADKCDLSPICHPNNPSSVSAHFAVLVRHGLSRDVRCFR